MRGYLATIYLGLFLATSLVPQGYMPLVNHEGLVKVVACTSTDAKVPAQGGANGSTYDCPFSLLQIGTLPRAESSSFPAGDALLGPPYPYYKLPERNYQIALPRGLPPIS